MHESSVAEGTAVEIDNYFLMAISSVSRHLRDLITAVKNTEDI